MKTKLLFSLLFTGLFFSHLLGQSEETGFKSYSKFDFVPGDKVIFYDDFADVAIGDFPLNWDTDASGEVVSNNKFPGKWFELKGDYSYYVPLIKALELPDNFTIEFDVVCPESQEFSLELIESINGNFPAGYFPGNGGTYIGFSSWRTNWVLYNNLNETDPREGETSHEELENGEKIKYSIWGQKSRLRVYRNEEKVLDVPKGINRELKLDQIRIGNYMTEPIYLTDFRIAVGQADTRNRLITEGKLVTTGIKFDSGSDKIRPESYGILKEISSVLQENENIRVKIVGHTDSDGDENLNYDLSKRRAASVKNTLSSDFGIAESRLETEGKGEGEPTDSNITSEGKANNRRVEFIKL